MLSMDILPIELWMEVISYLYHEDLLQFRLCSSRTVLSVVDSFLFKELHIRMRHINDKQRPSTAAERRKAATRMLAVSRSRIVHHVRVLELGISTDYVPGRRYSRWLPVTSLPGLTSTVSSKVTKKAVDV